MIDERVPRIPMIWSGPENRISACTDAIGQTHDRGTAIPGRASIKPAIGMQGISLLPDARDFAFIRHDHQRTKPGLGSSRRVNTLRNSSWRFPVFANVDGGEMSDLETAPGELRNLRDDPAHAETRARLMLALVQAECANVDRASFPTPRPEGGRR